MSQPHLPKKSFSTLKAPAVLLGFVLMSACGQTSQPAAQSQLDIIGGNVVTDQNSFVYKATAALYTNRGEFFCSGTVIDASWVVTAGHCLASVGKQTLIVGIGNPVKGSAFIYRKAAYTNQFVHPDFRLFQLGQLSYQQGKDLTLTNAPNDVALVKLDQPFPADVAIAQIPENQQFQIAKGTPITLAGFGATQVAVSKFGGQSNFLKSGRLYELDLSYNMANPKSKEIYLGPEKYKSACHGDSGGPAYYKDDGGKLWVIGATSRGSMTKNAADECLINLNIYTDLREFNGWINSTRRMNP